MGSVLTVAGPRWLQEVVRTIPAAHQKKERPAHQTSRSRAIGSSPASARHGLMISSRNSATCCGARPTKAAGSSSASSSVWSSGTAGSAATRTRKGFASPRLQQGRGGGARVHPQPFVDSLTIAAATNRFHENRLRGHEGQLCHEVAAGHCRENDEPVGEVVENSQDRIGGQKSLGYCHASIGGVVQGAFEPLRGGGVGRVAGDVHEPAGEGADPSPSASGWPCRALRKNRPGPPPSAPGPP